MRAKVRLTLDGLDARELPSGTPVEPPEGTPAATQTPTAQEAAPTLVVLNDEWAAAIDEAMDLLIGADPTTPEYETVYNFLTSGLATVTEAAGVQGPVQFTTAAQLQAFGPQVAQYQTPSYPLPPGHIWVPNGPNNWTAVPVAPRPHTTLPQPPRYAPPQPADPTPSQPPAQPTTPAQPPTGPVMPGPGALPPVSPTLPPPPPIFDPFPRDGLLPDNRTVPPPWTILPPGMIPPPGVSPNLPPSVYPDPSAPPPGSFPPPSINPIMPPPPGVPSGGIWIIGVDGRPAYVWPRQYWR